MFSPNPTSVVTSRYSITRIRSHSVDHEDVVQITLVSIASSSANPISPDTPPLSHFLTMPRLNRFFVSESDLTNLNHDRTLRNYRVSIASSFQVPRGRFQSELIGVHRRLSFFRSHALEKRLPQFLNNLQASIPKPAQPPCYGENRKAARSSRAGPTENWWPPIVVSRVRPYRCYCPPAPLNKARRDAGSTRA